MPRTRRFDLHPSRYRGHVQTPEVSRPSLQGSRWVPRHIQGPQQNTARPRKCSTFSECSHDGPLGLVAVLQPTSHKGGRRCICPFGLCDRCRIAQASNSHGADSKTVQIRRLSRPHEFMTPRAHKSRSPAFLRGAGPTLMIRGRPHSHWHRCRCRASARRQNNPRIRIVAEAGNQV
jgi:hypothetical protein